ncbi:MAG: leucine-rich repeat domain-containing protein [Bacteroidales bacterium]|nr:leucine-rich repeat domain-containing protein [Bacteroidales bacterium]
MKTRILNIGIGLLAAILSACVFSSCSKLRAGDTFTAISDGVEFQYEVIVSRMNFVRVIPLSPSLSGSVTIPSTVSYDGDNFVVSQIGKNAFRNCTAITSVTLPRTISIIEESAFAGCTALQTINTPQPLSEIGDYAFEGCSSLKAFSLEASLSALGKGCFKGCSSLKIKTFPDSFSAIPDEAFYGCASLEEIILPSTIMKIGKDAFGGCVSVKEIYLDRSVQSIGSKAFAGCINVESMTCLTATPPQCSADTFDGISDDIPVRVMESSVNNYINAPGWNKFKYYIGEY